MASLSWMEAPLLGEGPLLTGLPLVVVEWALVSVRFVWKDLKEDVGGAAMLRRDTRVRRPGGNCEGGVKCCRLATSCYGVLSRKAVVSSNAKRVEDDVCVSSSQTCQHSIRCSKRARYI